MKNPSVPLSSHDPRSIGLSCTSTFVPAIEIGCFMKSQCPCMMVWTEMFLLILDGLSGFKVNSVCGSRRSKSVNSDKCELIDGFLPMK